MAYSKQNFQNGQTLNAANLETMENGIIAGQGAHNLFDNSDFRNPVNQRGRTEASGNGYFIDRWGNYNGTSKVVSSGIQVNANKDSAAFLYQYIKALRDGVYTFAAKVNGNIVLRVIQISGTTVTSINGDKASYTGGYLVVIYANDDKFEFDFRVESGATITVEWAALYEGSYDASTLPPYVPKGKHVEMLNCNVPLAPRNLLDNSDFRIKNNIINTKGLLDYSFDSGDVFDRWRLHWTGDGRVSIKDGYVELYRKTYSTYLFQHPKDLESMIGKTYTVAAKVRYNGYIGWIDSTQRVNSGSLALNDWDIATCTFTVGSATSDIGKAGIEIATKADLSFEVQWVALYEGAYTKETLPSYVPKGKHVEMLNCNVPLAPHNLLDNSDFTNPVNQRGQTSYTGSAFTVDRWRTWNDSATITLTSDGIKGGGTDATVLYQGIELHKIKLGTAYTVAIGYSDSTISCATGTLTASSGVGIWNDEIQAFLLWNDGSPFMRLWHATKTIQWAAIYPGSYDASTLPAYQPKGYAAELAECMRYYQVFGKKRLIQSTEPNGGFTISERFPIAMRVAPTITGTYVAWATLASGPASVVEKTDKLATNESRADGFIGYYAVGIAKEIMILDYAFTASADL